MEVFSANSNNGVFFIAEIGINHNGDIDLAKKLIDVAVKAGASCVKFQKRVVEDSFTKKKLNESYVSANSWGQTYGLHKNHLEFSNEEFRELQTYAKKQNILFIATPCDIKSVDLLDSMNVPFYKVASGDLSNKPLLRHIALKGKPVILSTGMSDLDMVKESYNFVKKYNNNVALLSCTSTYPTPPEDINLNVIKLYKNTFPNAMVGYSGHETGTVITLGAVVLGAQIVERHITLDRTMRGSDHKGSLEPDELYKLMDDMKLMNKALGLPIKEIRESEIPFIGKLTKSLVINEDIKVGEVLTERHLTTKHPGTGLNPMNYYDFVLGKKVNRNMVKDDLLGLDDLV